MIDKLTRDLLIDLRKRISGAEHWHLGDSNLISRIDALLTENGVSKSQALRIGIKRANLTQSEPLVKDAGGSLLNAQSADVERDALKERVMRLEGFLAMLATQHFGGDWGVPECLNPSERAIRRELGLEVLA